MAKKSKIDRNRDWCKNYRNSGQREKNKARKLIRHLKRFPDDEGAQEAFKRLPESAKKLAVKESGISLAA